MLLFHGQEDLTYLELKTWRSFLCCLIGANHVYFDQLSGAADVLKMFTEMCNIYDTGTGKASQPAAIRVSKIVEKIAEFHQDVLGDYKRYADPEGPFTDILKSNDEEFANLKKTATTQFSQHQTLEKNSEKAWLSYMLMVKRKANLERKLAKILSPDEMKLDEKLNNLDKKIQTALSSYDLCYNNEVKHRELLLKQTENLREEFLRKEKRQLNILFSFINQTLVKLHKLAPHGVDMNMDFNFDPERPRKRHLAQKNWNTYLKEHTFPEKKVADSKPDDDDYDDEDESSTSAGMQSQEDESSTSVYNASAEDSNDAEILTFLDNKNDPPPRQREPTPSVSEQQCSSYISLPSPFPDRSMESSINYEQLATVKSEAQRRIRAVLQARQRASMEKVTAFVLEDWEKTNSTQISIRAGMKLMQIKSANKMGMAYGYKKIRFGLKKYGFYPADMVTLSLRDSCRE